MTAEIMSIKHQLILSSGQLITICEVLDIYSDNLTSLFRKVHDNSSMPDDEFFSYPLPDWVDDFESVKDFEDHLISILEPLKHLLHHEAS